MRSSASEVTVSSFDLRARWAEEMCQREHFQKLMVMVMRTSDKRVAEKYKLLLNYVVKQCDQRQLMETVTAIREDQIKPEEHLFIAQILYGCSNPRNPR